MSATASRCAGSPSPRSRAGSPRRSRSLSSRAWRIASLANSPAGSSSASRWRARSSFGPRGCCSRGRAVLIRPRGLLRGEPFSALDRNLRASMQVEIKEIQRKLGVTTIFVTHDQSEALSLSDRIAVLAEGRIRQLGTPDEIYCRPVDRFVASFVGDVNVLHACLEHTHGATAALVLGPVRVLVPALTLQGAAP